MSTVRWHGQERDVFLPTLTFAIYGRWESWPYLSPSAALGRVGSAPHLGSTVELALLAWVWVSQPGSSTEQPNPQIPDITSSSRPGPTASPSPSFLPPLWGQGRDSGLAQFRKDHPTHQGLTHSRAGLSGWPHPQVKAADKGGQGPAGASRVPPKGNICRAFLTNEENLRPTLHWPALSQRGGRNP